MAKKFAGFKEKEDEILKLENRLQRKREELQKMKNKELIQVGQIVYDVFGDLLPERKPAQEQFFQELMVLYKDSLLREEESDDEIHDELETDEVFDHGLDYDDQEGLIFS